MITNIFIGSFVFFFSDLPSKHPSVKSTRKQIASLYVGFFSPCCTANHSLMTLKMYTIVITALNYYLITVECVTSRKNISVLKGLQDYIGNVLWPSELSKKKTITGQGKAYVYKTILCQRRREKVSINFLSTRQSQPRIAFSCWTCVKSFAFTLPLTQHFPQVQLKRSKALIHRENTTTLICAMYIIKPFD